MRRHHTHTCKRKREVNRTARRALPMALVLGAYAAVPPAAQASLPSPTPHDAATHTTAVDARAHRPSASQIAPRAHTDSHAATHTNTPASTNARVTFNAQMLAFPVDVAMFAEGNQALPGVHRIDLYLNQTWKGKHDVRFALVQAEDRVAQACFDQTLLNALGFDAKYLNPAFVDRLRAGESVCGNLGQLIHGAAYTFDASALRLDVSAPQLVLARHTHGYVDPVRWDAGIPAATLDYAYNGWHNKQATSSQTSHYLGLRGGVNLGDWRMRYRAAVNGGNGMGLRYRGDTLTVERALPNIRSRLILGDTSTDGRVIDGVPFRGMALQSDERMQPDAMSSFAPVIRGIAQSNAKVTISQKESQIFETTVPPGPFVIDDLYANGDGGDLLVTITEADGSARSFTVTYANLPELLRPGVTRYSAALGEYRSHSTQYAPKLFTTTLSHGISNTATAYGGLMLAQGYAAATVGVGLNLPIGALALDTSYAHTATPGQSFNGASVRLRYTKQFPQTDTHVALTLAHDTNPGYYEPAQAFDLIDQIRQGGGVNPKNERRSQFSASVSQTLPGELGAVSFSGSVQDYWGRQARDVQYHLGYGRSFGIASASLTATRNYNVVTRHWDNQVLINLSMPLDPTPPSRRQSHMNSSYAYRPDGQTAQASVSATLGEVDQYHYNLYAATNKNTRHALRVNGGASLGWSTRVARMNASISVGSGDRQQEGLSASGGVVAFQDGLVFSPHMGETLAIVQAHHAVGAVIPTATGARLDAHGHAIVANLQPYRDNAITLDPKGLSTDVELLQTEQHVAPTEGAVVLLNFETRHGYSLLVTGKRLDDSFLPFAAGVFDTAGKNVGYLGQGGQALVRVDQTQGELQVRWGSKADQQCHFHYDLDGHAQAKGDGAVSDNVAFRRLNVVCA